MYLIFTVYNVSQKEKEEQEDPKQDGLMLWIRV
jgi:hypothetical protein